MLKKVILCVFCFFLVGCGDAEIVTSIDEDKHISISYPVTNINILDDAISAYVNKAYHDFKLAYKDNSELNISYTYKEVNDDVVNVSINTEIFNGFSTNKIKTFTYDKKKKKFLSMEDLVKDLDALDYDIKKALLKEYEEADMNFLNNIDYEYFSISDNYLTIYFDPTLLKSKNDNLIFLDIPLDSLNLLIDINKDFLDDYYIDLKKRNINYDDKVVALTFDDGPSKYTDGILNILKKYDACGTFFVIGNKVSFYKEVLVKMLEGGNEIGNHSYDHKLLTRLSENEFKDEVNRTQDAIKKVTGFTPKLFRPTYGGYNNTLKGYTDLTFVFWDVDSRDWEVKKKDKIFNNIMNNVKSGSIVLMHDNHSYALDSIESVVKSLKEEGYNFVTVSELLEIVKMKEEND